VSGVGAAIGTELLKARRSPVPWGVAVAFTIAPLVMGLFMLILENPELARSVGLLGAKAQLAAGTADWPTYLSMLGQAITVAGAVLFAFLTAWVFGREFSDRTVRTLLATPTRRRTIVVGKAIVIAGWSTAIVGWVLGLALVVGVVLGLPGWPGAEAASTIAKIALGALLTILLQTGTALAAGLGRGYLAGLAWAFGTVVVAQVVAVLGWGTWFPWSVPAFLAGAGGPNVDAVTPAAVAIVIAVAAAGLVLTVRWWERADQAA
jgi:ABC-2 type transport system permease protein